MLFEKSENKTLKKIREWIGINFAKLNISPNTWTIASLAVAITAFLSIINRYFLVGAFLITVSGLIDLIDGAVARKTKKVTRFGAFLDTVVDRYNEFLFIFPLVFIQWQPIIFDFQAWIFLFLFGSMITTYVKSAAAEKKLKKELRGGILERAERVGLYTLSLIIAQFNVTIFQYLIIILAILSNISAIQRILKAIR
ncbi:MAG: CDP-alcohol phosphatidyltransferase family protein [Candidatus Micrarchaeia archaeon]